MKKSRVEARPPAERLTTGAVRTILKGIAAKAGVGPHVVTPHRLRHYLGLASVMAGVRTTALTRAWGHRTPVMTARYSEFADAERRWAFARADITNGIALPGTRQDARVRRAGPMGKGQEASSCPANCCPVT